MYQSKTIIRNKQTNGRNCSTNQINFCPTENETPDTKKTRVGFFVPKTKTDSRKKTTTTRQHDTPKHRTKTKNVPN
jgi:hypothetical protein